MAKTRLTKILLVVCAMAVPCLTNASNLLVEIVPKFGAAPLRFDSLTDRTVAGQLVSVTRLDFLLSNIGLERPDGTWLIATNWFAYVSGREKRAQFELPDIPAAHYTALRFNVGLEPGINHADPTTFPAGHPLNPQVNALYWGWMGGYVFVALEGHWKWSEDAPGEPRRGYSFHLATDARLMSVVIPAQLDLTSGKQLSLALDVARVFSATNTVTLDELVCSSTHSRVGDDLAARLQSNFEQAFSLETLTQPPLSCEFNKISGIGTNSALKPDNATAYRFRYSKFFPQPSLPLDNPLTDEGVALGRRLFFDSALSRNERQSCASCHEPGRQFSEPKPVSTGTEGQAGARNAPALQNLAWRRSLFWDGRTATLRQQVLEPIQNTNEMHETLTRVLEKLRSGANKAVYAEMFSNAFGDPEISSERIARALEQFLLTQVSCDSKFDRVLKGQAQFTAEEQRGFELFQTEYDPRRGQYGADCFHCHGGPLLQSQSFANNGLDSQFVDRGRAAVTGNPADDGKFAVPSLRNVELTGPYMHDGRFATIEQVVEHYVSGVKRSATLDPNLAKHPDGGVPLSSEDQHAIVAFLKTLTEEKLRAQNSNE